MTLSEIPQNTPSAASNVPEVNLFSEFSIGSLLLRMGKITTQDAERIMKLQKDRGIRFGEAAQSLGLINESDIQQVLARQFDYPYLVQDQAAYPQELIAAYQPFSKKAEVLRAVRSQLMLHWFSKQRKSLAIASVNFGEGTSYFAANLAVVFSQLGEKTLLIDANLRHPKQHEIFNLKEKRGLSDNLAGRAGYDAIANVGFFENLSVLPAGTLPPNPQELVSRTSFPKLIAELSEIYDVILIDSPPFAAGADVQAISIATGGAVIVARQNHTKLSDIEIAADQLGKNGSHVIGSVLVDF